MEEVEIYTFSKLLDLTCQFYCEVHMFNSFKIQWFVIDLHVLCASYKTFQVISQENSVCNLFVVKLVLFVSILVYLFFTLFLAVNMT